MRWSSIVQAITRKEATAIRLWGAITSARRAQVALLAPSSAVFLLFFVAPILYFFVVSFWRVEAYKLVPAATLANYATAFDEYSRSLIFTFVMALVISTVVTVLAFVFAYGCRFRAGRYGTALLFVALVTLFGGYLTKIYMWKTILGQKGVLNSALMELGIISEPITAFLYNPVAVVITLGHYMLPLAVLPIYGSLRSVEDVPLQSARDLGASRWRVFRDIILPQCRVGLLVAFALTFLFAAGDFVTPRLVGGPHTSMIGTFIQLQFGLRINPPMGSATAFVVIGICIVIVALVAFAMHRALRPK